MFRIFFLILIASGCYAGGVKLPAGVTMDSVKCTYATGQFAYNFLNNNELVAVIQPSTCYFSETQGGRVDPLCFAEFYMTAQKDTFATKQEAMTWLMAAMQAYYAPLVITKWKTLRVQPPKVTLKYPWDWDYRLDKYNGIFNSKAESENKLTLMYKDYRGQSEILMLIRTPNTKKMTMAQVMEMASQMNRAIDLKRGGTTEVVIGGKKFKSSRNSFMMQMEQYHFWYADEQEIIYLNYNLLKDDRTRYPEVMKQIVESITW